ncbi:MAG: LysM peptidoglycan-binding domain-containing protein [Pirellulaceae bacterium]
MQTIKTGVVIVLLIAVCYGAFVALNVPEADIPEELQQWANSEDFDGLLDIEVPTNGADFTFDTSGAESIDPTELMGLPDSGSHGSIANNSASSSGFDVTQPAGENLPVFPTLSSTQETLGGNSTAPVLDLPPAQTDLNGQVVNDGTDSGHVPVLDGPAVPFVANGNPNGLLVSQKSPTDSSPAGELAVPLLPVEDTLPAATGGSSPTNYPDSVSSPGTMETSTPTSEPALPTLPFEIAREQALMKAANGSLREALEQLSAYYESVELGRAEHTDLVDMLDALSRETIYSKRHLVQKAYVVTATDTLDELAKRYQVSPELLGAINGMGESTALVAGSQLKVLPGPFHARISMNRGELTVFLGKMYAGRFPISINQANPPREGIFEIVDRRRDRAYYGPGGVEIQAGAPDNPYGGYWLSLANNIEIHGSPEMARSDLEKAGCISLAPLDAADVYSILTKHSQVEIRK